MLSFGLIQNLAKLYCSIQFKYGSTWGPERGYTGGGILDNEMILQPGEFINRINMWSGDIVDVLTFYSDTGKRNMEIYFANLELDLGVLGDLNIRIEFVNKVYSTVEK